MFLSVLVEQIGLPLPSIPILMAVGALSGMGKMSFLPAMLLAVVACLIADNIWYWLGVYRGASILNLLCRISLEPDTCVRKTENMFLRFGVRGLLFSKFVPGLNTAACPMAGMFRVEIWKFCVFDGLGSLIWVGAYSGLGYLFRDQFEDLVRKSEGLGSWILAIVGLLAAAWILWKYIARRRVFRELRIARIEPQELLRMIQAGQKVDLVDLRSAVEWEEKAAKKLPGALHLSFEELDERAAELPKDSDVVLYCSCPNEISSVRAALQLKKHGVKRVRPLAGGYETWRDLGYPLEDVPMKEAPQLVN